MDIEMRRVEQGKSKVKRREEKRREEGQDAQESSKDGHV
jgi:hypothetical protein